MDMDMSSSNSSMMVMMVPWLHFTGGDNLFFDTWHPSSKGAIAGACIGLVLLAIFERWVNAMHGALEAYWGKKTLALMSDNKAEPSCHSSDPKSPGSVEELKVNELASQSSSVPARRSPRTLPPFIPSHDIPRGMLYAFQALLSYALMLAVMTFQAAFIISIVVGSGIGEVLFGRVGGAKSHLMH
ncbi:Ctr copper transporter [Trametes polyzona]|nr:Ctr copper transporter [Trametes polyzona]